MSTDDAATEIDQLIRSRQTVVAVQTHEEARFERIMREVQSWQTHNSKPLYRWSRTSGLVQIAGQGTGPDGTGKPVGDTEDPQSVLKFIAESKKGLFVLNDFAQHLAPYGQADLVLVRELREVAWTIRPKPVTVFLVGPTMPDILDLEKEVRPWDLPLPKEAEVAAMLDKHVGNLKEVPGVTIDMSGDTHDRTVFALLGLTDNEIESALARAAVKNKGLTADAIPVILDEKRNVIRKSGSLTYTHPEPESNMGGYDNIRTMLRESAVTFTPAAQEFGVEPSRGVLLIGPPGNGKDAWKRVASSITGRPLLDLDFGSVMGEGGGILGQAEMSIKRAVEYATLLKGVLGMSEFEKAVGGLQSSNRTDGGSTARTISYLLNWMADQNDVFVIATANDVRQLAPEQIRQGRFSSIVFVDLPTFEDRVQIFTVHLTRRNRTPEDFDLDELAEKSEIFSGAEIEAAVKGAILDAFMDGARALTTGDIVRRCGTITPIGVVKKQEIDDIREWAAEHLGAVLSTTGSSVSQLHGERSLEW